MATGIAIMGFGGGALIASPWSAQMLESFGSDSSGIALAFLVHGLSYAVFMLLGVLLVRVPRGAAKTGRTARPSALQGVQVSARSAMRTPQFWCLWVVLCMNVTAGIGILEKAAPMITDFFADTSTPVSVSAAAGFVALLSAANMAGRIGWSSTSDLIGRKNIYRVYLGVRRADVRAHRAGSATPPSRCSSLCALVILSFYGGGFATIPAYLKDLFGTYQVGAIHGRLLTAWSTAGVLGPLIVNWIADRQEEAGKHGAVPLRHVPLHHDRAARHRLRRQRAGPPRHPSHHLVPVPEKGARRCPTTTAVRVRLREDRRPLIVFAWLWVGAPLAYGLYELFRKATQLFTD